MNFRCNYFCMNAAAFARTACLSVVPVVVVVAAVIGGGCGESRDRRS